MGAGILRAVGDSRRPLYFLIISTTINIVLDLLFVTQFQMGISGVAIATVIAQAVSAVLVLLLLSKREYSYRISWRQIRIDKSEAKMICMIGFPSALQMAVTSFSNVFVQTYINRFGSACMAGWTAFSKIDSFMMLPVISISLAVTTFVGQNLGAGKVPRAMDGIRISMRLAMIVAGSILIPLMIFTPQMVRLFNQEKDVLSYGIMLTRLISPFYLFLVISQILTAGIKGAGDTKMCMILSLSSMVVFRQVYLAVAYRLLPEVIPVVMGYPAGWIVNALMIGLYYRSGKWKTQKIWKGGDAA